MLVYIGCAGGATSSLFCKRIAQAAERAEGEVLVADIVTVLPDLDRFLLSNDIVLAYGPATFLTSRHDVLEHQLHKQLSSVWLAPQVRYLKGAIEQILNPHEVPVKVIDMKTFGKLDGEKALEDILDI